MHPETTSGAAEPAVKWWTQLGVVLAVCAGLVGVLGAPADGVAVAGVPVLWLCFGLAFVVQWLAFVPAFLKQTEHFVDAPVHFFVEFCGPVAGSQHVIYFAWLNHAVSCKYQPRDLACEFLVGDVGKLTAQELSE